MTKFFLKIAGFLAITGIALLMISCEKENMDTEVTKNFINNPDFKKNRGGGFGMSKCFEFVFPIAIEFSDGTTKEVADLESLQTALMEWKSNKSADKERPSFVFPLEVTKDGETISITDKSAIRDLAKECSIGSFGEGKRLFGKGKGFGKEWVENEGNRCFKVNFPVSLNYPDDTTVAYEDGESIRAALEAWRSENRGFGKRPMPDFPITVELEDGTTKSIDGLMALLQLRRTCNKGD